MRFFRVLLILFISSHFARATASDFAAQFITPVAQFPGVPLNSLVNGLEIRDAGGQPHLFLFSCEMRLVADLALEVLPISGPVDGRLAFRILPHWIGPDFSQAILVGNKSTGFYFVPPRDGAGSITSFEEEPPYHQELAPLVSPLPSGFEPTQVPNVPTNLDTKQRGLLRHILQRNFEEHLSEGLYEVDDFEFGGVVFNAFRLRQHKRPVHEERELRDFYALEFYKKESLEQGAILRFFSYEINRRPNFTISQSYTSFSPFAYQWGPLDLSNIQAFHGAFSFFLERFATSRPTVNDLAAGGAWKRGELHYGPKVYKFRNSLFTPALK